MGKIWIPIEGGKYWLPKQSFLTVYHYCLQYPEWEDECSTIRASAGIRAVSYTGMPHGTSISDPTSSEAIRLVDLDSKMQDIRDTVHQVAPEYEPWLLKGVTEDRPYWYLRDIMRIPCCKEVYYDRRRQFYYLMAKKILKTVPTGGQAAS